MSNEIQWKNITNRATLMFRNDVVFLIVSFPQLGIFGRLADEGIESQKNEFPLTRQVQHCKMAHINVYYFHSHVTRKAKYLRNTSLTTAHTSKQGAGHNLIPRRDY